MPPKGRGRGRTSMHRNRDQESFNDENANRGPENPMLEFVEMLMGAFQNRTPPNPNATINPPAIPLANFKDFKSVGPPEFRGTSEPIEAQTWVKEIEKAFDIARVSEEQKTSFAAYLLKGEANYWWEANKIRAGDGVISWEKFKEIFFENYFPDSMQGRMEVRFLELKQGDMTVSQYAAKFNELARFAPHQVDTEIRKTRRFELGLKPQLFSKVAVLQAKTFGELLKKALIAEEGSEVMGLYNKETKNKAKLEGIVKTEGSSRNGSGKRKWNNTGNMQGDLKKKNDQCSECGKNHWGVCLKGRSVCFNCGQEGHISPNCPNPKKNSGCFICGSIDHMVKDCPKKRVDGGGFTAGNNSGKLAISGATPPNRPIARTFNMTVQDAVAARDGGSGTIPITYINAYV